ncbi:heavy metal-associated isoprenylated plant protein 8-like protein, partial [Tanacetum coccineum]
DVKHPPLTSSSTFNVYTRVTNGVTNSFQEQQKNQEEKKDEAGTGVGDKNAKGSESLTNENKQKDNKQNYNKQTAGVIVLGVHLHCQGCVETVVKSLRGFDGVEVVEPNTKDNRVTVKEKNYDPVKIAERVKSKSGKHVEIISPVQKKQQEKKPQEKKPRVVPKRLSIVFLRWQVEFFEGWKPLSSLQLVMEEVMSE